MKPCYERDAMRLYHADCLDLLSTMESNSVDSLVTDPPASISFMGKGWDSDRGGRTAWVAWLAGIMAECLRVLKPGAHGLVWALPRTSHWTATALEDAGLEVREKCYHIFGQGFPKSLDVSKAIDKAAGADREVVGTNPTYRKMQLQANAYNLSRNPNITAPATDAARQWEGWGTALKPAVEEWILVRKPLAAGTVAANVLEWGCGGLNIDGCRVGMEERAYKYSSTADGGVPRKGVVEAIDGRDPEKIAARIGANRNMQPVIVNGRWPANLILSHHPDCNGRCVEGCPIAELDRQSGYLTTGARSGHRNLPKTKNAFGHFPLQDEMPRMGDSGGASRFFYQAKPSRRERGEGNNHPTVKSIALMRYLCRLITPPGGLVLDPFAGSGSTALACISEGFRFVGCEQDEHNCGIAARRLDRAMLPLCEPQKEVIQVG